LTTNRREFLEHSLINLAGAAGAASLTGLAQAHTHGSAQSSGTWTNATDAALLAQAWALRFSNALPNPLDPRVLGIGFIYRPDAGTSNVYTVAAGQTQWDILGIPGKTTTVWGYGNNEGGASLPYTFPGRTFVVKRNAAINVRWLNRLSDATGHPLPHLLPVD
jgi:hypothetical protein